MKKYTILLLAMLLLLPVSMEAQRRKKAVKKPVPVKEEVVEEDPRILQMLESTQRIVFIDSIVVDKRDFMAHIPLSPECGSILQNGTFGEYTNELNDYRIAASFSSTDSLPHLTATHLIGTEWTMPTMLKGIDKAAANYPYLLPDGTTLYFAQKGEKSIGGYDIFVTRFDASRGEFLRPENIGMPFSSEANDYLYVVDETYQLGYFVTDRRQPAGKVCIYVFIPSATRRIYQSEAYSEAQLRSLAAISRIADTWEKGTARTEALDRLAIARSANVAKTKAKTSTAVRTISPKLEALHLRAADQERSLQLMRHAFAQASDDEKHAMRPAILQAESELEALQLEIKLAIKEFHNQQYQP